MKAILTAIFIVFFTATINAQELFPMTEPASTLSKGVLGIRAFDESYNEPHGGYFRSMFGLKAMYGVTPKLTLILSADASNHHSENLPPEFPDHNTPQVGVHLPYLFNGFDLYAKYRFVNKDAENSHFRMAAYGEYSLLNVAHDEAEPALMDDTRGFGAGIITTYLKNHFAASFTGGVILPSPYTGIVPDFFPGLPSVGAKVYYGKALVYDLSFGYLLLPNHYKSYKQTNINLYLEFLGKSYEAAKIILDNIGNGAPYPVTGTGSIALGKGHYVEVHPGIQAIIQSNLRIDFSMGFPVIDKSYTHFYPLYSVGIQRYFYFNKKK